MPGILDFLQSPEAQLGIGLLAAGGPTTDPNRTGLGQRLSGALQSVTANQAAMTEAQLKKAQLADELQKTAVNAFQLKRLQDWQAMVTNGAMGGVSPTGASPAATAQAGGITPPQAGDASIGAPSAGMPAEGAPSAQAGAQGGGFQYALPGVGDQQSRAIAAILPPADYMKMYADKAAPQTDIGKLMVQAGIDPKSPLGMQLTQTAMAKANYTAPVNARPGSILRDPITNMPIAFNPHIPDGWTPQFDASGNVTGMSQIPNSGRAIASVEQAKGEGQQAAKPTVAYDASGRPIFSTGMQDLNRANGVPTQSAPQAQNMPAPMRNNNPGALMPGGKLAQFDTPEAGIAALDHNLQRYASQGINTVSGIISKWAPPNENNTNAYINSVATLMGVKPDTPLNMSSPVVRHMVAAGIMRQENGSGAFVASAGGQAPQQAQSQPQGQPQGSPTPVPMLGATANANAAQEASATTMHSSYAKLQSGNSAANAALDALVKMQGLAAKKNALLTAGALGTMQTAVNPDAAEYEKQRANVISLLAAQNGTNGTDAGRALTGESVPDFGKPKSAIQDGLETLKNQTIAQQLKINLLTPVYQSGDSKAYTNLENQFDQNISPSIVPLLTMPPGQSRAMLLKKAASNPSTKAKLNWAAENGLLK